MKLALLRHAPTTWNKEGRLQGLSDIQLSRAGRAAARGWRLPDRLYAWRRISSPLLRALETAALTGLQDPEIDPRLREMDWGNWEGQTLDSLRHADPTAMATNEAAGLDFRPPDGESPREVRSRLLDLVRDLGADGRDTVAVTHRGVMRAALSAATGWDFTGAPPVRMPRYGLLMLTMDDNAALFPDDPPVIATGGG
ncbi:MAG: histidine phosphatase family protein [bacterium]|nr:histidine phosphatase family protein [bacterium]